MKIGLDGRYISDHFPGIGRYIYNLACAMADVALEDRLVVLVNADQPNSRYSLPDLARRKNVELVTVKARPFSAREHVELPWLARRERLDLLHSPYYVKPYALPVPSVTTVYDVTPTRYPEYLPGGRQRAVYELTTRLAVETSAALLTLSESARQDMIDFYGARPERITVTYPAADARFHPCRAAEVLAVRQALGLPEAYILYVGINKPHKNQPHLVEAFARLARAMPDIALALAGKRDPRYPEALDRAAALGVSDRVVTLDNVPEEHLPALYSGAALFAFPSLYEGFGFPVLEAMACGAPTLTSTTSSLPEVAGEAALLVPPDDVEGLARAMIAVLQDGRLWTRLHRAGLERATKFSWITTAEQTLDVYRRVG